VGREDLAGVVEGDDRDLLLVDHGEDPPAGDGRADLEVVVTNASRRRASRLEP
jgi:hypothetical protein